MTSDKDSTCDEPFQVVLIDIQKAAKGKIYCVKKPLLGNQELKYMTISYRWGELLETNFDTRAGYVASITSFDLQDFYRLCKAITNEPDLRTMEYVWVDAICVNQSNYDERKATIYHMSDIYEQATWILAVPDLHAEHLKAMTNHKQAMASIQQHQSYIYHLLHGNVNRLDNMDQAFLDTISVPQDPYLRKLLIKHTRCFAYGFMTSPRCLRGYKDDLVLAHLFDIHQHSVINNSDKEVYDPTAVTYYKLTAEIDSLHQCNNDENCPFSNRQYTYHRHQINGGWHMDIIERTKLIKQAMYFLTDLVVDWSSRVWVISEFHIAKKKNSLKFWFTQLNDDEAALTFYKFDLDSPPFKEFLKYDLGPSICDNWPTPHAVYPFFYKKLINQLDKQTFVEMILRSKASKNEDRLYSILPLFPEYKHLLQSNKELTNNVSSTLSVKLKLYQIMTNEHKTLLLFLSAKGNTTYTLPTFATTSIDWNDESDNRILAKLCHKTKVDIALFHEKTIDNCSLYYLKVKPSQYHAAQAELSIDNAAGRTLARLLHHPKRKTLGLEADDADTFNVDVVGICMPTPSVVFLIGSLDENIWILSDDEDFKVTSRDKRRFLPIKGYRRIQNFKPFYSVPDNFPGFRVY